MRLFNGICIAGALFLGLALPAQAFAAAAIASADVNIRVGPGTDYGSIDIIPELDLD